MTDTATATPTDGSQRLSLACSCGKVTGYITTTKSRNAIRCYCHSCRAYGNWCRQQHQAPKDNAIDDGGVDILQVCKKDFVIEPGCETHIQLAKLNSKTFTYRFYSACCMTPLCNSNPSVGFVGLVAENLQTKNNRDRFAPYHLLYSEEAPDTVDPSLQDVPKASLLKFLYLLVAFLPWRKSADFLPFTMEPNYVAEKDGKEKTTNES